MPQPYLIVDNTLPCDLPDLYDGIGDNPAEPWFDAAVRVGSRVWRMAFWVALGLCVGVFVL